MAVYDQFIPAKWYRLGRPGDIRLIVIHCTVSAETGTGAEAVARYFARGDRRASAHAVVDNNSSVGCVHEYDTAFAAAGANRDGIHLELVGMADQSAAEWQDEFSLAMFDRAGPILRDWSHDYAVPLQWLDVVEVADGKTKGMCTHADVSAAFPDVSTGHYDPGPEFPKAVFLDRIQPAPPAPTPQEDDVPQLVKKKGDDRVVITGDFVHGRHVDAAEYDACKVVCNQQNPHEIPAPLFDAIKLV